ncbi:hypothetical protein ZL58_14050 [Salmonella enterica subsp. enterica serovar Typhimurium]|nr:hypothetical protein [Salmonella enterica subsp. enterica serovar Typhimurium]
MTKPQKTDEQRQAGIERGLLHNAEQARKAKQKRAHRNNQVRAFLREHFPFVLNARNRRMPYKRAIVKDLAAYANSLDVKLTAQAFSMVLGPLMRTVEYQQAMIDSMFRYDVFGHPVEDVTNEDRQTAQRILAELTRKAGKP